MASRIESPFYMASKEQLEIDKLKKEIKKVKEGKKINRSEGSPFKVDTIDRKEHPPVAVLEMDLTRHSLKAKSEREELTPEGMALAAAKGRENSGEGKEYFKKVKERLESGGTLEVYGSPRERTIETSTARMLGEQFKDVKFEGADAKEIVDWLKSGGRLKDINNNLLNFLSGHKGSKYFESEMKNYTENNFLTWSERDSDKLAIEDKQNTAETTTFSIHAGNIAKFIKELGKKKTEDLKGSDFAFITSHQGVLESFLIKVMRKKGQEEDAKKLLAEKTAGFDVNEGFKLNFMRYSNDENDWAIEIFYGDKKYVIGPIIINELIIEGLEQQEDMKTAVAGRLVSKRSWRDWKSEVKQEEKAEGGGYLKKAA